MRRSHPPLSLGPDVGANFRAPGICGGLRSVRAARAERHMPERQFLLFLTRGSVIVGCTSFIRLWHPDPITVRCAR